MLMAVGCGRRQNNIRDDGFLQAWRHFYGALNLQSVVGRGRGKRKKREEKRREKEGEKRKKEQFPSTPSILHYDALITKDRIADHESNNQ